MSRRAKTGNIDFDTEFLFPEPGFHPCATPGCKNTTRPEKGPDGRPIKEKNFHNMEKRWQRRVMKRSRYCPACQYKLDQQLNEIRQKEFHLRKYSLLNGYRVA